MYEYFKRVRVKVVPVDAMRAYGGSKVTVPLVLTWPLYSPHIRAMAVEYEPG